MIDLLFINPGSSFKIYQELSSELTAVEPPVWAGLLAGAAEKAGFTAAILDAHAEKLSPDETAQKAAAHNPKLIAVVVYGHNPSASTQIMPGASAICREIKKLSPESKIILIGGHVSALPECTLIEEACDFVCDGEGPETLFHLLSALSAAQPNFSKIPDLWYREEGIPKRSNAFASLLKNLDKELPGIAWHLLPMPRYRAHNWHCFGDIPRQPYAALYTTLGCPYHCEFCCIQAPFKNAEKTSGFKPEVSSYRFWSPSFILSQIDLLVQEYGVRNVKFADEMFVLNKNHVRAICEGLIQRNYGLNIWAYARIDTIPEDLLHLLKQAGFRWLALGIESADSKIREGVSKKFAQDLIEAQIQKIHAAGIYIIANYIFGLPGDTLETMNSTLNLALKLKTAFVNFYCTMAYPGSALYDKAEKQGLTPSSWSGYSQHSRDSLPLAGEFLSAAQILEFRDRAFEIYFNDPNYLKSVRNTFGQSAVLEIQRMLSIKLSRNHA